MKSFKYILAVTLIFTSPNLFANRKGVNSGKDSANRQVEKTGRETRDSRGGYKGAASRAAESRKNDIDPALAREINEIAFLKGKTKEEAISVGRALELTGMRELKNELEAYRQANFGKEAQGKELYESVYELMIVAGKSKGGKEVDSLTLDFLTRHIPDALKEFSQGPSDSFARFHKFVTVYASLSKASGKFTQENLQKALSEAGITYAQFKQLCGRG